MGFTHRRDDKLDPPSETFAVKVAVDKEWAIAKIRIRTLPSDELDDRDR